MTDKICDLSCFTRIDHDHPWFAYVEVVPEDGVPLRRVVVAYLDQGSAIARVEFLDPSTGTMNYSYPRFQPTTIRAKPGYEQLWQAFLRRLQVLTEVAGQLERQAVDTWDAAPPVGGLPW